MKKIFVFLLIFLFTYLLITPHSFAQTPNTLSVLPSILQLDLATDPPEAPITYTNSTDSPAEVQLSASDFTELEDSYKLEFLDKKDAANYKYSLSSWISFETNDFILNPHESKDVKVFIDKNRLTTGGHYASIQALFLQKQGSGNVTLHTILSSLLFVRTNHGNEVEDGKITLFQPLQDWWVFPDQFAVKVENTGNVQFSPHGLITVTDLFNRPVATGIINEGSLIAIPESVRRYDVTISRREQLSLFHSSFLFPGIYHADIYIHFGKKDKTVRTSTTFFSQGSINWIPYGVGVVILGMMGWRLLRKKLHIPSKEGI